MIVAYSSKEVSWAHPWKRIVDALVEIGVPTFDVSAQDPDGLAGDVLVVGSWHFLGSDKLAKLEQSARGWKTMTRFVDDWRGDIASQIKRARRDKINYAITQIPGLPGKNFKRYQLYERWFTVNLNALANTPCEQREPSFAELLYYGAYRPDRIETLRRYPFLVISSSKKGAEKFGEEGFCTTDRLKSLDDLGLWSRHLYAEDTGPDYPSHYPSCRLYEVWRTGRAIFFDINSVESMRRIGIDPWPIVSCEEDVARMPRDEVEFVQRQWSLPTRSDIIDDLRVALGELV